MKPELFRLLFVGLIKLIFLLSLLLLVCLERVRITFSDRNPRTALEMRLLLIADCWPETHTVQGVAVEVGHLSVSERSQITSCLHVKPEVIIN